LRPDVAVVLPNSFEAALSAWYWRAGRRIGFDTQGRGRLLTDRLPLPCPRQHQIDEYLALAAPLDAPPVTRRPSLSIAAMGDLGDRGRALLDEIGVSERPVAGIHLGAAFGPSKLWPADRIASLCAGLRARGVTPVLLGPPPDAPIAQDVQAGLSAPVPSLIGRDTPELMPGVLAALDVLVSGDTGTAHLAAALGVRTVTLFGPTDPDLSAPRGDSAVIVGAAPCAPCFYADCPIDHVCMRAIGVEEVLDVVLETGRGSEIGWSAGHGKIGSRPAGITARPRIGERWGGAWRGAAEGEPSVNGEPPSVSEERQDAPPHLNQ
jgi:heptosyltransferase-2